MLTLRINAACFLWGKLVTTWRVGEKHLWTWKQWVNVGKWCSNSEWKVSFCTKGQESLWNWEKRYCYEHPKRSDNVSPSSGSNSIPLFLTFPPCFLIKHVSQSSLSPADRDQSQAEEIPGTPATSCRLSLLIHLVLNQTNSLIPSTSGKDLTVVVTITVTMATPGQ